MVAITTAMICNQQAHTGPLCYLAARASPPGSPLVEQPSGEHTRSRQIGSQCAAQAFLTKLLTVDLPGLMVLPKRLEVNIPPSLTSVAEAAVGRDAVMRAVASAVLQVKHTSCW